MNDEHKPYPLWAAWSKYYVDYIQEAGGELWVESIEETVTQWISKRSDQSGISIIKLVPMTPEILDLIKVIETVYENDQESNVITILSIKLINMLKGDENDRLVPESIPN
jgi:hypothetical protein